MCARHLIDNLWKLHTEMNEQTYMPQQYNLFYAQNPKIREIFAPTFRDRIVHHLLISYLEPLWEKWFIFDSYSCRKNKGTHKAVFRTQNFSRKECNKWYIQLDIKSFFVWIDKMILKKNTNYFPIMRTFFPN